MEKMEGGKERGAHRGPIEVHSGLGEGSTVTGSGDGVGDAEEENDLIPTW